MARGLALCSNGGKASILHSSSVARISALISRKTLFASRPFHGHRLRFARFFCKCASVPETVDVTRYKEVFRRRMAMAGLKPDHRIALGVSGGPDSMALCVLAANWKTEGQNVVKESGGFIEGLLAIVVDHGLRPESRDEAEVVSRRVYEMGIRCEIARCDWKDGRPKQGHLQEAAREMRYQMLQNVCFQHQFGVLLVAHHADDQAELFILRLSRNSGVLGLAGMPFTSEIFSREVPSDESIVNCSILLVRPLLDFWKEEMYKICWWGKQFWVEDPTNQSQLFVRNRIRTSLSNLQSRIFKSELQAIISECRKTRSFVDQVCSDLIHQTVTITDEGYAVLDLWRLNSNKVEDVCLSKFVASVLQFISQRQRPIRGNTSKLLLNYLRSVPCKTSLTAAGCYLCPAPGSKGAKVIVCCSVDCPLPSKTEALHIYSDDSQKRQTSYDISQIIAAGKSFSDRAVPNLSEVQFLDILSDSVLTRARELNLLSESTYTSIGLLHRNETNRFKSKTEEKSIDDPNHEANIVPSPNIRLWPGQACYFMNRFLIRWSLNKQMQADCRACPVGDDLVVEVAHMAESHWLYLIELSKCSNTDSRCSDFLRLSAQRALVSLKSIPSAARRSLPVLVNLHGLLLSIPLIGFRHCPCLEASARFRPRVPLGGGHGSFM